ncbi:glycine betaine ABC transporter substrate-binding protein [Alcaligenes faecalis]|uniref:glycine betaine ABC transporter substrate-binding protein n=1 Tax=Alcaligenes faecalis TaxID=511 RepID=UPI0035591828
MRMHRNKPYLALWYFMGLWLCLWGASASAQVCADGKSVRLADLSWESAAFSTELYQQILEKAYGCKTERVPGSSAALESALAQNDIQVIGEIWSGRTEIIEKAIEAGQVQVLGNTLKGGAEQGWYVPDYVVDGDLDKGVKPIAPNLQTVQDLKRYAAVFRDPEQPDKGRFYNCPSGWVCETFNSRLFDLYGLGEHYQNFRPGTGAALDAAISAAYDRRVPILFYYWQPAGLMAKYSFKKLASAPFNESCWKAAVSGKGEICPTDFIVANIGVAASTPFVESHPELVALFEKIQLEPGQMNEIILGMTEGGQNASTQVQKFLKENEEQWRQWMPLAQADRLQAALEDEVGKPVAVQSRFFPEWSAADWVNRQLLVAVQDWGTGFRQISSWILTYAILPVERVLQQVPAWAILVLTGLLAWWGQRRFLPVLLYAGGLYLIGAMGLWDKLMQTFTLVLVATVFSVLIGVPVGILSARSRLLRKVLTPVLDVMQTMPSFVYLIPVLMLFGLGKVPAVLATVVYAVPPLIRLTSLGLQQVDKHVMEAAQAYGVTRWQMLMKVTLPLARPSIMAGINQTTMMALSMVVVASMIGAQGLGEDVLAGIQTLDIGRGLQAGVAIVILAIVIDRISQSFGRSQRHRRKVRRQA